MLSPINYLRKNLWKWLREAFAIFVWVFLFIKIFLFDIDVVVINKLIPNLQWLLIYKSLIILSVICIGWLLSWLFSKQKNFLLFAMYVAFYPLVILFWHTGRFIYYNWPLVIAFAPVIHLTFSRALTTLILYTVALTSTAIIFSTENKLYLWVSIALLSFFLLVHIIRKIQETFGESLYGRLAKYTRKTKDSIVSKLVNINEIAAKAFTKETNTNDKLIQVYMFHSAAEVISKKVKEVAQSKKYDMYLASSLVYTYLLTATIFAIQYFGLSKISSGAFTNSSPNNFWQFFELSLGILSTDFGVIIQPSSTIAHVLCRAESTCLIIFVTILGFSVFTSSREGYRQETEEFRLALNELATSLEEKVKTVFKLTFEQIEISVLKDNRIIVNYFRRAKGHSEYPAPVETTEVATNEVKKLENPNTN